jgi:hypothetical protein
MIGHDGGHEQSRTRITDPQVIRALAHPAGPGSTVVRSRVLTRDSVGA